MERLFLYYHGAEVILSKFVTLQVAVLFLLVPTVGAFRRGEKSQLTTVSEHFSTRLAGK
jgi:hypothetical protein